MITNPQSRYNPHFWGDFSVKYSRSFTGSSLYNVVCQIFYPHCSSSTQQKISLGVPSWDLRSDNGKPGAYSHYYTDIRTSRTDHGRTIPWTIKTPNPMCRLYFKIDLLTDFAALCLTDFIDWRYIHCWLVFSTQLGYCCPHWWRNYTCVLLPLYLLSDLPPSSQTKCAECTGSVLLWGGAMSCVEDHILQKFYTLFLTRFRTYKIASPPETKMISKDDIQRLVSLEFLRLWYRHSTTKYVTIRTVSKIKIGLVNKSH
jgi:hypothetical protein